MESRADLARGQRRRCGSSGLGRALALGVLLALASSPAWAQDEQVVSVASGTALETELSDGSVPNLINITASSITAPGMAFTTIDPGPTLRGLDNGSTIVGFAADQTFLTIGLTPASDNEGSVRFEEISLTDGVVSIGSNSILEASNTTSDTTFSAVLTGDGGLTKRQGGVLTLDADNTYMGSTLVGDGTLRVMGRGTRTALPAGGAVAVATGATLEFQVDAGPDTAVFDGAITADGDDTATVLKTGAGTLRLSGDNDYAFPTMVSEGTLELMDLDAMGGADFGSSPITVDSGATLRVNQDANDGVLGAEVSGDGLFVKEGASQLRLTASDTALSAGSVQITDGVVSVTGGTVTSNVELGNSTDTATLILRSMVDGDAAPEFSGAVTRGAGALTTRLRFNGADAVDSDVTTGTYVFSGSTEAGVDTFLDGGSLRLIGNPSFGSGIESAGTIFFSQTGTVTFSDEISQRLGALGYLVKDGSGTVTIDADQSYTGDTAVMAGTLIVDASLMSNVVSLRSGATLTGSGDLNGDVDTLGGTLLTPIGGGTLNVGSLTLDPTATLEARVDGSQANPLIDSAGPVDLGDATLRVTTLAGGENATVTLLRGSAISGVFSNVAPGTGPIAVDATSIFVSATLETNATEAILRTMPTGDFTDFAQSGNQANVASVVDTVLAAQLDADPMNDFTGELAQLVADRVIPGYGDSPATVAEALDTIGGEIYTAMPTVQRAVATQFAEMIRRRGGAGARRSRGADLITAQLDDPDRLPSVAARGAAKFDVWMDGFVTGAIYDGAGAREAETLLGGPTLGVEIHPGGGLFGGMALGYVRSDTDLDGLDAELAANTVQTGVYAGFHSDMLRVLGLFRYAWTGAEAEREIQLGSIDSTADAELDGHEVGIVLDAALDLPFAGPWRAQPGIGFAWSRMFADDIDERGAGGLSLRGETEDIDSIVGTIGVRVEGDFSLDPRLSFTPWIQSFYAHEFGDDEREVELAFATVGLENAVFRSRGASVPQSTWRGAVGWDVQLASGLILSAAYDIDLASSYQVHTGRIGGEFRW